MTCTPNHLLIERGVKLRAAAHFIMEETMGFVGPSMKIDNDRLRAVNAKLLVALEEIHDWAALGAENGDQFSVAVRDRTNSAIEANK